MIASADAEDLFANIKAGKPDIVKIADGEPHDADQQKLSDAMVKYWTNFAKAGDPNDAGLPAWPKWSAANEQTQLLDAQIKTAKDSGVDRKCEFWDAL